MNNIRTRQQLAKKQDGHAQLYVFGDLSDLGPEHVERLVSRQQGGMPHVGVEQPGSLLEAAKRVT